MALALWLLAVVAMISCCTIFAVQERGWRRWFWTALGVLGGYLAGALTPFIAGMK